MRIDLLGVIISQFHMSGKEKKAISSTPASFITYVEAWRNPDVAHILLPLFYNHVDFSDPDADG
jgi:hypothetical protein